VNEPTDTPATPIQTPPLHRRVARTACALSLILCIAVTLAYLTRHDGVAAVTVFPSWVWGIPGVGLVWFARRPARRLAFTAGVVWLVFLVAMIDRPGALIGTLYRDFPTTSWSETPREQRVRVISLNCGGGGIKSIAEVAAYQPDIVLLQESPGRIAVGEAACERWLHLRYRHVDYRPRRRAARRSERSRRLSLGARDGSSGWRSTTTCGQLAA